MTITAYEPPRTWLELQNPALELANAIAGTDFVPTQLRNNPAAITAAILYGDEVGLGPMQSLAKIAVINGRPTLAAEAQRALILRAGHDLWIEESTPTRCTVAGRRRESEATSRVTWTMDDAKRANLGGKPPWKMYPRQMLLARASAELARAVFPDAIGGLAATEELDEDGTLAGPAVDNGRVQEEKKPASSRRRRANTTAGPAAPAPAEPAAAPLAPDRPPLPGEEQAIVDQLEQELDAVEEAAAEPEEEVDAAPPITDAQRRKLHALLAEKGIESRDDKIAYSAGVIARPITSSNDLTLDEASRIIDHLDQYDKNDPQTWPFPAGF